jgi:hypothetical protein
MRPDKPFSIQGILGQLPPYALYMVVTTVYAFGFSRIARLWF